MMSLSRKKIVRTSILLILIFLGIRIQHWTILKGSMDLVHGDMGDSRFNNILLEHGWKYISGHLGGASFWSPTWLFFPAKNTLLYSDVMLGAILNYAPFRFAGFDAQTSYQLWHLTNSAINFLGMFFLCHTIGYRFFASAAGAWLFAFGLIRGAYLPHSQLMPHYYVIFSIICAISSFRSKSKKQSFVWAALSGIFLGMQFWVGLYIFWLSVFLMILALCLAAVIFQRSLILSFIIARRWALTAFGISFCILVTPLALRYLSIQKILGSRNWSDVVGFLPGFWAFFLPPPDTWFYNELFQRNFCITCCPCFCSW